MDKLTRFIKVRVDEETCRIIRAEADCRHLKSSDIQREAFREYIMSHNLEQKHKGKVKNANR